MAEFRQDFVTKRWVIIPSQERQKTLKDIYQEDLRKPKKKDCPFCRGNEHLTKDAVFIIPENDTWMLRVVPNKFPILDDFIINTTISFLSIGKEVLKKATAAGAHEVIIETPDHYTTIGEMSVKKVQDILEIYRDRYNHHAKFNNIKLITVFRNYGAPIASQPHPHSQLMAIPIVPPYVRQEVEEARRYYDNHGACIFCDMIEAELKIGDRIVDKTPEYLVFEPFASSSPFETWIIPIKHQASFAKLDNISHFAEVLNSTLAKLHIKLGEFRYSYIIKSAPLDDPAELVYHWYLKIAPRFSTPGGFEWATDVFVNLISPEQCTIDLRTVQPQHIEKWRKERQSRNTELIKHEEKFEMKVSTDSAHGSEEREVYIVPNKISVVIKQKITEFLASLPNIQDNQMQRGLILRASLDSQLQQQIDFAGAPEQFIQLLVSTLDSYGMLEDGRDAFEAVLEATKHYVGKNRRQYCNKLIKELRAERSKRIEKSAVDEE